MYTARFFMSANRLNGSIGSMGGIGAQLRLPDSKLNKKSYSLKLNMRLINVIRFCRRY